LSNDQRWQMMMEHNQKFNKAFSPTLNETITDPKQRERFQQLQYQYQGLGAFSDPTIQERLKLTPEQRQKLNQYGQEWYNQMGELGQGYQSNPEAAGKRFNEMWKQSTERLNTVLTPEQQRTWSQIIGEPYNFQPSVFFGSNNSTGGIPK